MRFSWNTLNQTEIVTEAKLGTQNKTPTATVSHSGSPSRKALQYNNSNHYVYNNNKVWQLLLIQFSSYFYFIIYFFDL